MTFEQAKQRAECPKCDPCSPELDEDGRPYSCYFCGDSGYVPAAAAAAYWQDLQDDQERFAPVPLGIFYTQAEYRDAGEYGVDLSAAPGYRMFSRLLPRVAAPRSPGPADWSDDIPF